MTIDFGEANKQKTPEGYEECHAIIGFDSEGMLRISETDEEWEPDECERSFFRGNVQRVVYYHKAESRPVSPIQYFIMDNFSRDVRKFYHIDETRKETPVGISVEELAPADAFWKGTNYYKETPEKLPDAPGNTEPAYVMGYPFPTMKTYVGGKEVVDNTGDYIPAEESEPQKTADSLLSEILKRPMKTIFDRD